MNKANELYVADINQKQKQGSHVKANNNKKFANTDRNIQDILEDTAAAQADADKELCSQVYEEEWYKKSQNQTGDEYEEYCDWERRELESEANEANALENRLKKLEKDNESLKEKLDAVQRTVYQLLGGLYNHQTQNTLLGKCVDDLFLQNQDVPDKKHRENIYPTTRQGDQNEERIQSLEEKMDILIARLQK